MPPNLPLQDPGELGVGEARKKDLAAVPHLLLGSRWAHRNLAKNSWLLRRPHRGNPDPVPCGADPVARVGVGVGAS